MFCKRVETTISIALIAAVAGCAPDGRSPGKQRSTNVAAASCRPYSGSRCSRRDTVTRDVMRCSTRATGRTSGSSSFADVSAGSYALREIEALWRAGITKGCSASGPRRFCPSCELSRQQLAAFLVRIAGRGYSSSTSGQRFTDVGRQSWYARDIDTAVRAGWLAPCGSRRFCPEGVVPRKRLATAIVAALGLGSASGAATRFSDVPMGASYAGAVGRLAAMHAIRSCSSYTQRFCPDRYAKRSEAAFILARAKGLVSVAGGADAGASRADAGPPSDGGTTGGRDSGASRCGGGTPPQQLTWPVPAGTVTQSFGSRPAFTNYRCGYHAGLDIGAVKGAAVLAVAAGKVVHVGPMWYSGSGKGRGPYAIIIEHGSRFYSTYGHNSRALVSVGDCVSAGDKIAEVGDLGLATGPHLHLEIVRGVTFTQSWKDPFTGGCSAYRDPQNYLQHP